MKLHDIFEEEKRSHRGDDSLRGFERTYKAEITSVYRLTERERLYQVRIMDPEERADFSFRPGQFVMLECPGVGEAPFSISSSESMRGTLELCIRAVGGLTRFLSRMGRGLRVGIRGPFGTSFPMERMQGESLMLIAGGLGLAPLRAPLFHVLENRSAFKDVKLIYGAKNPSGLLFTYQYAAWEKDDIEINIVVDDIGQHNPAGIELKEGIITDVLKENIDRVKTETGLSNRLKHTYAIVCGPPVMFRHVCDMLRDAGMPMQRMFVSLERRMHCGVGKCCRCNVGSTYTCLKGPVFDYWSVMNLKEAI